MKIMRKELNEVKNAMEGRTTMNLDGMIKRIDHPSPLVFGMSFASQVLSPIIRGL